MPNRTDKAHDERILHCAEIVETHDRDRYLTAMTAPPEKRGDLMALYAFNLEVARTREAVSEPMMGHIRLQWWRDAIEECYSDSPRRHWVVESLAGIVRRHDLPRDVLDAIVEAREGDLEPEPLQSRADFDRYCRTTGGGIARLAAMILVGDRETASHAADDVGTAWAIVGTIRALPFTLRRKDWVLPQELMTAHGLSRESLGRLAVTAELKSLVAALLDDAAALNRRARQSRSAVPSSAGPAMIQARLTDSYIRQLRKVDCNPFDKRLATPPPMRALSLAWANATGRW